MILTVSLRSVFQAESERECSIIFEKLGRERIPPDVVTFLKHKEIGKELIILLRDPVRILVL